MKTLIIFAVLICSQTSAQTLPFENTNTRFKQMLAQKGNVGGGGNTIDNQMADARRIELVIRQTPWFTRYLLNDLFNFYYVEIKRNGFKEWFEQEPTTWMAWNALFGQANDENIFEKLTVFERMKNLNIDIRHDRPCDFKSEHKQASADLSTLTICFSISEILKKKHVNAEIEKKMVALFMHELTHLMGAEDETIANSFQTMIEERYAKINFIETDRVIKDLIYEVNNRQDSLQQDLAEFSQLSRGEKCWRAGLHFSSLADLTNAGGYLPRQSISIRIYSPEIQGLLNSAAIISYNAGKACNRLPKNDLFTTNDRVSVYEYTLYRVDQNSKHRHIPIPAEKQIYESIMLTRTNFEDYEKLHRDLEQVENLLRRAEEILRKYPRMNTMNYEW